MTMLSDINKLSRAVNKTRTRTQTQTQTGSVRWEMGDSENRTTTMLQIVFNCGQARQINEPLAMSEMRLGRE